MKMEEILGTVIGELLNEVRGEKKFSGTIHPSTLSICPIQAYFTAKYEKTVEIPTEMSSEALAGILIHESIENFLTSREWKFDGNSVEFRKEVKVKDEVLNVSGRCDAVAYDKNGIPIFVIEFKTVFNDWEKTKHQKMDSYIQQISWYMTFLDVPEGVVCVLGKTKEPIQCEYVYTTDRKYRENLDTFFRKLAVVHILLASRNPERAIPVVKERFPPPPVKCYRYCNVRDMCFSLRELEPGTGKICIPKTGKKLHEDFLAYLRDEIAWFFSKTGERIALEVV